MKPRQLAILIVILAVLVGLVVIKQRQKPQELSVQEYTPLNLAFESSKVASIEVLKPQGKDEQFVEIVKTGDAWTLKSLESSRADQTKVEEFLKELQNAKGELRGRSKDLFADFGIGDDDAYTIRLNDAEKKTFLDLRLGIKKAGAAIFIRYGGNQEVFFTQADLFGKIGIYGDPKEEKIDNNFWAATHLIELDASKLISIEGKRFKDGKEIVASSVTRKNKDAAVTSLGDWRFSRENVPFAIDPAKVVQFVDSFKTWKAQRVLDPKAQDYGFDKPQWQMTFAVEGKDQPVVIKAGKTDDASKSTYMQVSSEPVVFQMSPYYYENMDADDSRFITENPLGVDTAKTEKLVVAAADKRKEVNPKEKQWDGLNTYLNELKGFRATRVLWDSAEKKKAKSPSKYFVEVKNTDQAASMIIDFGDVVSESPKEYAAMVRGKDYVFSVSNHFFNQFFDDLSKLDPPAETPKTAEAAPQPAS